MSLHHFRFCGTFRNCKKYCAFVLLLVILFRCRHCLFGASGRLQTFWTIEFESNSLFSPSNNYESRSATLGEECNRSHSPLCDQDERRVSRVRRTYQSIELVTFLLRSKSLMYCAVPKMATKTILSLLTYVYLRDLSDHLERNQTNFVYNRTLREQLIGVTRLAAQFKKVGQTSADWNFQGPNTSSSHGLERY